MLSSYKPVANKILLPVAMQLRYVNPNIITFSGMIFPVLFITLLLLKLYILSALTFILNFTDMLDGLVARSQNKVTPFGGFLDSTLDRISDFIVISAFGFANLVPWIIIIPLLLTASLISYIRSRTELAAKNKLVAAVGIVERTERIVIIFTALVLYILFPNNLMFQYNIISIIFIILLILSCITIYQRMIFAYKKL